MTKAYETIFILDPDLTEEATKANVEKFKTLVESNGTLVSIDEWGKRRLAYPINHKNEGYYVFVNFTAEPSFIAELERIYRITSDVIKFITVKK